MKVTYTQCDKCADPISSGYVLTGTVMRLAQDGTESPLIDTPGDYCSSCLVGMMIAGDETAKYGTETPEQRPRPPRVKPLL